MLYNELTEAAKKARKAAQTSYSKFAVGAAILMKSGKIFGGCTHDCTSTIDGELETVSLSDLLPHPKQGILESFQDV